MSACMEPTVTVFLWTLALLGLPAQFMLHGQAGWRLSEFGRSGEQVELALDGRCHRECQSGFASRFAGHSSSWPLSACRVSHLKYLWCKAHVSEHGAGGRAPSASGAPPPSCGCTASA